jgi:hypothetical protein
MTAVTDDDDQPKIKVMTASELLSTPLPPRRRRGAARIEISSEPVKVRGEELSEIWWRGAQWAVTAYGIECLDGTYVIESSRLLEDEEYPWPRHMAEKIWVDLDEFVTAWMIGLFLHGHGAKADIGRIRKSFAALPPSGRRRTHRSPRPKGLTQS